MNARSELAGLALAVAALAGAPRAFAREPEAPKDAPDPLNPLRERFRQGMESYKAGRYADAILVWEAIFRELGAETGYRLAFNLGRAYDAYGDSTRAAEHYETFLRVVARRRERQETLEANVAKQEDESRERLGALAAAKTRIRVLAGDRAVLVQIDRGEPRAAGFVAYVAPGQHTIVFAPGKGETRREIEAKEGELVELAPPPPAPVVEAPARLGIPGGMLAPPPPSPEPPWQTRTERPFAPWVLWVAGGVTVVSIAVPAVTYASALSAKMDYDAARTRADGQQLAGEYDDAKSTAYVSLAVPAACAALTGGLVAWWLVGSKERKVPVPAAALGPGGATLGVTGAY